MHSQMGKQSINQDLARATTSQPIRKVLKKYRKARMALGIEVGMSMKEAEKKLIFETLRETGGTVPRLQRSWGSASVPCGTNSTNTVLKAKTSKLKPKTDAVRLNHP